MLKKIKGLIFLAVLAAAAWFLVVEPLITFHNNEKKMEAAARRYFDLNNSQLPSGERVRTLELQKLYDAGLLDRDFYIPLTKKTCSNSNSWVKVRRENGEYKYYVYLECGYYKSSVDHEGPVIRLYGDEETTLGRGEKYKELGVKSVVDNKDGKLKIEDVIIKGNVNSKKAGTYKVRYIAYDNLSNKTEVVRTIKVVRKISSEMKDLLENDKNFKGDPNNFIMLSNMMFRVYGLDEKDDVIVVSDIDISNVNYSKLDKWLDYFYDHLNEKTKQIIVEKKYCNMKFADNHSIKLSTCNSYTEKRKIYIPSANEVLSGVDEEEYNFMRPSTISWIANSKDNKEAYVTRDTFYPPLDEETFVPYSVNDNYGVRPMFTIKGNTLIKSGDGTYANPYSIGDNKKAKGGTPLNERETGEYVNIDDVLFRIIEVDEDGTTKVISDGSIEGLDSEANSNSDKIVYNPKDKYSVAYRIINTVPEYLDTSLFIKHNVEVPVYKKEFIYGEETKVKKYNLLLAAPDTYEMFSAQTNNAFTAGSYWLRNESQKDRTAMAVGEVGVPTNMYEISHYDRFGFRVVGHLKKGTVIVSGKGTDDEPYIVK